MSHLVREIDAFFAFDIFPRELRGTTREHRIITNEISRINHVEDDGFYSRRLLRLLLLSYFRFLLIRIRIFACL